MNKTSFVRARMEPSLKNEAEDILEDLGISPTQAVTMLYKRIARDHEWPLELKIPNEKTRKAIEEADEGIDIVTCENKEELFRKLRI